MEQDPGQSPERQSPRRGREQQDLRRLAESRRALDARAARERELGIAPDEAGGRGGPGGPGQEPSYGDHPQGLTYGAQNPSFGDRLRNPSPEDRPQGPSYGSSQPRPPRRYGETQARGTRGRPRPASGAEVERIPRQGDRLPAPYVPQRPMNDLTTTMPILVIPDDDRGVEIAPPGEHGHFHIDEGAGRHRAAAGAGGPGGGGRTRVLLVAFGVAMVAGIGLVVSGALDGKGGTSTALPTDAGPAVTTPAAPTDSGDQTPAAPDPAATDSATPTATAKPTVRHTTPRPVPSTTPVPARPTSPAPTTSVPTSPSTTAFQTLVQGMSGPAVQQLQDMLSADPYNTVYIDDPPGYFGPSTYSAVRSLQNRHRTATAADGRGKYGAATDAALRAELNG